jgi:hypothetical protein
LVIAKNTDSPDKTVLAASRTVIVRVELALLFAIKPLVGLLPIVDCAASGGPTGTIELLAVEASPVPAEFVAVTVKV